jgi:hypothetical protein
MKLILKLLEISIIILGGTIALICWTIKLPFTFLLKIEDRILFGK